MGTLMENRNLRDLTQCFRDREDAGEKLAAFLQEHLTLDRPVICPIPAGGVPIGVRIALTLKAPLILAVVRKLQIPWNTESGFGAVTWDGHTVLNQNLVNRLGLTSAEIAGALARAKASVEKRIKKYPTSKPRPPTGGSVCVITDDGLASGYTMRAAIEALRLQKPARIIVAIPTGSLSAVHMVSGSADDLICLNIRGGSSFAVADAYQHWRDLTDEDVLSSLRQAIQEGLY